MNLARITACSSALVLSIPGIAAAKSPDAVTTQAATAKVPESLTASFPTQPLTLSPAPGAVTESAPQMVNIKSNKAWALNIAADKSPMASWNGSSYGADALSNPLEVSVNGVVTTVSPGTDASGTSDTKYQVTSNAQARRAGDAGTDLTIVFRQRFSYADAPGDYRSTVTYTASQTF